MDLNMDSDEAAMDGEGLWVSIFEKDMKKCV